MVDSGVATIWAIRLEAMAFGPLSASRDWIKGLARYSMLLLHLFYHRPLEGFKADDGLFWLIYQAGGAQRGQMYPINRQTGVLRDSYKGHAMQPA